MVKRDHGFDRIGGVEEVEGFVGAFCNTPPAIAKAEEILEHLGTLEEIRRYYEAREMAIHDEIHDHRG